MKKIGFVFFDNLHIVHHFISVAVELNKNPIVDVDIITYKGDHSYLFSLLKLFNTPKNIVKEISTFRYRQFIEKIKKRAIPSSKYLFEKNIDLLLTYDVLAFTDLNHEYVYKKRKGNKPKFVLLMHGAGDGEYLIGKSYKDSIAQFDLITTSGQKVYDFFNDMGKLPKTKIEMCGYQKFDVVKEENKHIQFFTNKKPTVLYNPHFKEELSSWDKHGTQILDYFYNNDEYNLIFAPHYNLFNKKGFLKSSDFNPKYKNKKNIHIDLGSVNSVNMSYTLTADIYLGDVSSQVYEFLNKPKPCIFINSHNVDWKNNKHYQNWKLGKVISDINDLYKLLNERETWQTFFMEKQKKAFDHTFYQHKKMSPGKCIAYAILSQI